MICAEIITRKFSIPSWGMDGTPEPDLGFFI